MRIAVVVLAAWLLPSALFAAILLAPVPAGAQPVPGTTVIGTPGGRCLTAQDGHSTTGTPVVLARCAQRPAQQWVVGSDGTWQLNGTAEFVTVTAEGTLELGPAGVETVYVNHRIAADGGWLTWKPGDRAPFLQVAVGAHQTWHEFTTS